VAVRPEKDGSKIDEEGIQIDITTASTFVEMIV